MWKDRTKEVGQVRLSLRLPLTRRETLTAMSVLDDLNCDETKKAFHRLRDQMNIIVLALDVNQPTVARTAALKAILFLELLSVRIRVLDEETKTELAVLKATAATAAS